MGHARLMGDAGQALNIYQRQYAELVGLWRLRVVAG